MENSHGPFYSHQPRRQGSRSAEYVFSTIALLTAAASLIVVLIVWVNASLLKGSLNFDSLAFPAAALVVALPILAGLSMDLNKAELKDPGLALDPYKIRSAQFTKIIAFATCFFTMIGFVYGLFTHLSNESNSSLGMLFADVFIILAVAGGILAYYMVNDWRES